MMPVSRRAFVGGSLATMSGAAFRSFGAFVVPHLTFGVVSDLHIGGKPDAAAQTEKALRWFASKNVDAVLCPGDIAHSGHIGEMEKFAAVWYKVFPGGFDADGRRVELMISTGNHDIGGWGGRWANCTEEQLRAQCLCHRDNLEKTWRRLFGRKWELIWRREVKGYTFIGSQWSSLKPPIEAYMKENAATLDADKPFFYCQHQHPKGTCHGAYAFGDDNGESVRALEAFPNAVAISGHSHCAISDERTVWQGAFTSIGAGCLHEGGIGFDYDNCTAHWHPSYKVKFMASMADPQSWGGDAKGGCCELVEVFDDHLVVHRQSVVFGRQIGPSWNVPLPARRNSKYDFMRRTEWRKKNGAIPQFAADAKITVKFCPNGHALEGVGHKGEPCIHVTFPRAKTIKGSRVFDYTVEACADGMPPVTRKLIAAGFAYPEEDADLSAECLFSVAELPCGKPIRFMVTPHDCFGLAGRSLVGKF